MTIGILSAPARPVRWSLVTTVAAALALAAVPAKLIHAQAPSEAPAQQQAAGPPSALMSNLVYSPWTKICVPSGHNGQPNQKPTCFTGKDAGTEQGAKFLAVALVETEGEPNKWFRVPLPFGVAVTQGIRLIIDQNEPLSMPFMTCAPLSANMGCIGQVEATPDLISKLKTGQMLTIEAFTLQNQTYSFPLALADFAKANEGPAFDPKVYEERQKKKMQDNLPKKPEMRM